MGQAKNFSGKAGGGSVGQVPGREGIETDMQWGKDSGTGMVSLEEMEGARHVGAKLRLEKEPR